MLATTLTAGAQNSPNANADKPTIIFVHGVWADGSCWNDEITAMQNKGYQVVSVQNPLTSLADFAEKSEAPAWKQKPTWYIVATEDKAIHPDLERFMSKKMKANTTEIVFSHVVMNSHPKDVVKVIEEAASFKY